MERQDKLKEYVVIYKRKGMMIAITPGTTEGFNRNCAKLKSEGKEIVYSGRLDEDQHSMFLEEIRYLNFKPYSEVSKKVDGLVTKLKGETGETH
jgi:hypothetical protein